MTLPIQNTAAYWTPERRAQHSARCRRNPIRERQPRDILKPQDREAIVADVLRGLPYLEIAQDWLVSESRIAQIAVAAGLRRHAPKVRA